MDFDLLSVLKDELEDIAETVERLRSQVEEAYSRGLRGPGNVDSRCRETTQRGHQCTRRARMNGPSQGYCLQHGKKKVVNGVRVA